MRKVTHFMCLVCLVAGVLAPAPAATQYTLAQQQLWLARSCVHELSWSTEHDCEPMYQVFMGLLDQIGHRDARGRRRTVVDAIRIYQRRFWAGISNRPWARLLHPRLAANPPGWPAHWPNYTNYVADFNRVYAQAGAIVRGQVETRCTERPRHWGSRNPHLPDIHRAAALIRSGRWREVDCGPTIQAYYAVVNR